MMRLRDRSKAPLCWWYPVPRRSWEVRHQDVVREVHKQYSETINKVMFTLLGVALFCLLTVLSSPDKLLLAADSMIKVPVADAPLSFVGFIVVAPLLLVVLTVYLHILFRYWLDCEWERQYLNQKLRPPIESIPTLFSFPDAVSRFLTGFIFYWLVPLVLGTITWKAWANRTMGLFLMYVSGVVTFALVVLQCRRRPDNQRLWWTLLRYTILILIIGLMVRATFNSRSFQRPLNLFRAELPKAWLVGVNMSRASAGFANLQGTNLQDAKLQGAFLQGANLQDTNLQRTNLQDTNLQRAFLQDAKLQGAFLQDANLQGANLQGADLQRAHLQGVNLQDANLQGVNLQDANLQDAKLQGAFLQDANLQQAFLQRAHLQGANLQRAHLQGADLLGANLLGADLLKADLQRAFFPDANLQGADLRGADLLGADLLGADLQRANLTEAKNLTQDQINTACVDEDTKLPAGLTKSPPCPASQP
jgi:uncharacterized protein YjbI with pentapeptide repeats